MTRLNKILVSFFCLGALIFAGPAPVYAKEIKLGWNIRNAANFMSMAAKINRSSRLTIAPNAEFGSDPYKITYIQNWHKRFKEDIDYLFAVNRSHIFIAFRGTDDSRSANLKMNENGPPNLEYGTRVHKGWWRVAQKAWRKDLWPLVKKHLGNRKILVTGHSMGGAVAAYVVKQMQKDRGSKKTLKESTKLRLVTYGAPRYTFTKKFFNKKNTLIFTVEATQKNKCVDNVVWDWQVSLRKHHPLYKKVDIQKPKRKKGVYYRRCKSKKKSQSSVHNSDTYLGIARSGRCNHVAYKACKPYKKYVD